MKPEVELELNDYIRRINSNNPNDWPIKIFLADSGLTDEDIQPLWDAISNNPNAAQAIKRIRLYGNQLTSFRGKGLGALQDLNLSDNKLTSFSGEGLGALHMLFLGENRLTSFSGKGLRALQLLDLSDNQITSFSGEGLEWLQSLGLANNQLTSVCKIMLEAMRPSLEFLNYSDPINQQALTSEMLAEHFNSVLNTAQRELSNAKSWLSMVRRIRALPDELFRMVFECVYGIDHILQEMNRIKQALPGQTQNLEDFEKSDEFAEIKRQYDEHINSLCKDSFRDAKNMKTLLTAYKQWGKYTTNYRYLQDNSSLDPRDNPFQLALRN